MSLGTLSETSVSALQDHNFNVVSVKLPLLTLPRQLLNVVGMLPLLSWRRQVADSN